MDFNTWIGDLRNIAARGYVGSVDNAAESTVTVLWYGGPNATQKRIAREAVSRGITVKFQSYPHSDSQIKDAVAAIWKTVHSDAKWKNFIVFDIIGVDSRNLGSITVEGNRSTVSSAASARMTVDSLSSAATDVSGIPVVIRDGVVGGPAVGRASSGPGPGWQMSRYEDVAPFNAGDLMTGWTSSGVSEICSTGFAIRFIGSPATTTARHCDLPRYTSSDGQESFGESIQNSSVGQMKVMSEAGSGSVWDDPPNTFPGIAKAVKGTADVSINDVICSSGANSGTHCNLMVEGLKSYFNDGYGLATMIVAQQQTPGAIANMQGDSGGPVFFRSVGTKNVIAVGMAQATTFDLAGWQCGPSYSPGSTSNPNYCGRWIFFSPLRPTLAQLHATLITS